MTPRRKKQKCKTQDYRSPRISFENGTHFRFRTKRHFNTKYDTYHYFMPAAMSHVLRQLKRYFNALDNFHKDIPEADKFRQTPFGFAETAIQVLQIVRSKITQCSCIQAGTMKVSPVAWAIFGPTNKRKMTRHHFVNTTDVFNFYAQFIMMARSCNVVKIDRPHQLNPEDDLLIMTAETFGKSTNVVLTTALMLLYDLVRYCGPETTEFPMVWGNDKRPEYQDSNIYTNMAWKEARSAIGLKDGEADYANWWSTLPVGRSIKGSSWLHNSLSFRSSFVNRNNDYGAATSSADDCPFDGGHYYDPYATSCNVNYGPYYSTPAYYKVNIADDTSGDLTEGEVYELHENLPVPKQHRRHERIPLGYGEEHLDDDDEDRHISEYERRMAVGYESSVGLSRTEFLELQDELEENEHRHLSFDDEDDDKYGDEVAEMDRALRRMMDEIEREPLRHVTSGLVTNRIDQCNIMSGWGDDLED